MLLNLTIVFYSGIDYPFCDNIYQEINVYLLCHINTEATIRMNKAEMDLPPH